MMLLSFKNYIVEFHVKLGLKEQTLGLWAGGLGRMTRDRGFLCKQRVGSPGQFLSCGNAFKKGFRHIHLHPLPEPPRPGDLKHPA